MDYPKRDHRHPGTLVSKILFGADRCSCASIVCFLVGWALARFPHLVTPDVTIQNAAAPESTLKLLLLALGARAVVLSPSLLYLLQIFKRQEQR
jgi:cytochrome bd-type quinol oxidase subunit 2